jgi:hypothetical protein
LNGSHDDRLRPRICLPGRLPFDVSSQKNRLPFRIVGDCRNELRLRLLSSHSRDPLQRELLLRLEISEHPALILELVLELLKLTGLVLKPPYVAVETFLAIRQALFATFQVGTQLPKLGPPSA